MRREFDRELFSKDVNLSTWDGGEECSNPKTDGEFRDALWKISCDDSILAGHH